MQKKFTETQIQDIINQVYFRSLAHGKKLNYQDSEDVVSDTLLNVLENNSFDPEKGNAQAYIAVAAMNNSITAAEAMTRLQEGRSRKNICTVSYDVKPETVSSFTCDDCYSADHIFTQMDEAAEAEEAEMRLHAAIAQLSPVQQRTAIMLSMEMTNQEMAEEEGVALNVMNKRVHDTRKALRVLYYGPMQAAC